MTIRVTNSSFVSIAPGEYETVDDAFQAAVAAGIEIAAAEVRARSIGVIVEIAVDLVGRPGAARGAVAISSARFLDGA